MPRISTKTMRVVERLQQLEIAKEFEFSASRSGGAGGQNVNKVNTKAELRFHIDSSQVLSHSEKELLHKELLHIATADGYLIATSSQTRSQLTNRDICQRKLLLIIAKTLTPKPKRVATAPSKMAKERRLDEKKQHSATKSRRQADRSIGTGQGGE